MRCGGRVTGGRALEQEHEDAGQDGTRAPSAEATEWPRIAAVYTALAQIASEAA